MMGLKVAALLVAASMVPSLCCAGDWELGGAGGFGFYRDATISATAGSARTGFGPRFALGGVVGKDFFEHFGGEFRYTYRDGDLELASGGQKTALDAYAEAAHADLLVYPLKEDLRLRPFFAFGAGLKFYSTTETPAAGKPLQTFAVLKKASQAEPLISFGGGIKYAVKRQWLLRLDFRDYLTPFPDNLISPAPGAKLKGWLHDFVFLVGVSYVFGGS